MKRILAVFVAAVFFLGSSFSFASTEMLLSDKSLYLMIEKHNAERLLENFEKLGELDFVKFSASETPLKFEMDLEIDSSAEDVVKRNIRILDEVDEKEKYERAEIKVYNNDQYITTLEAVLDGTVLSFRLPELYEKYITIDLGNLTELCEKFGMPKEEWKALEENYKMQEDLKALMVLSEEQEKDLTNCVLKCGLMLNNLIKEEYFIKDNNAVVSYEDKVIPCRSLSLEIPQRDMIQIVKTVLNKMKNDEKVMKIFEEKLMGFYEIYKEELTEKQEICGTVGDMTLEESRVEEPQLPTLEEILKTVDEMFIALEEMYGSEYDTGRIVSKIYFEEDYDIIKREFGIKNESRNYNAMLSLTTLEDYYALECEDFLLEDRILRNENMTTHHFTYEYLTYDYDFDEDYNIIKTEKLETEQLAVNIERLSEQAFRVSMDFDEFNSLEVNLATEKLSKDSAMLNYDMRLLHKADPSLQTLLPQSDTEVIFKMKMVVTQNHKIVKEDLSKNEINLNTMSLDALEQEWKEHEAGIMEKGDKLVKDLFPELVKMAEEREKLQEENERQLETLNQQLESMNQRLEESEYTL